MKSLVGFVIVFASTLSCALDSAQVFKTLQSLQGKWSIASDGKTLPFAMTYDLSSKESIVTEQFGKELSVFYLDGQRLLMTHFCNRGSQPRLQLQSDSANASQLDFKMIDITGLKNASDPHVGQIHYKLTDKDHFSLELVWRTVGAPDVSEKYTLTRIP